jgi:hypothetical protein
VLAVLGLLALGRAEVASAAAVAKGSVAGPADVRPSGQALGGRLVVSTLGVGKNVASATLLEFPLGSRDTTPTGSLAPNTESDPGERDVYRVYLRAGEPVGFVLDADPATDFGLSVYGPNVWDIRYFGPVAAAPPYYSGGSDSYPVFLDYTPLVTGYYYVVPYTWHDDAGPDGGAGDYQLDVMLWSVTTNVILQPTPTQYDATPTVSGRVVSRISGEVPEGDVLLSTTTDGVHYEPLAQRALVNGAFSFTELMPEVAQVSYQVQYLGSFDHLPSSGRTTVLEYALVEGVGGYRVSGPGTRSRDYFFEGRLLPWHPSGGTVRLYVERKVGRKWKRAGTYGLTLRGGGMPPGGVHHSYMPFMGRVRFPVRGRYRLRPLHSDASHAPSWGPYTYLYVR